MRRDDERASVQRVRGDERDDEPLHAPCHHGSAVGQVVSGRSRRGGDDEAVAVHAPDLVVADRVHKVGDALAGLPVHGQVVDGQPGSGLARSLDPGQGKHLVVTGEGAPEPRFRLLPVHRGQKPDLAEVDREHGNLRARVRPQPAEDGAVASDREADVDVPVERRVEFEPRGGLEPVLACLLPIEPEHGADVLGDPQQRGDRRPRLLRAAVGEHGRRANRLHGSTSRAARSRSSSPGRPPSAIHTNDSRLPLGPGSPDPA